MTKAARVTKTRSIISSLFLLFLVFLTPSCGSEVKQHRATNKVPCQGDPCFNPRLAPQTVSRFDGGRFGTARNGGKKAHNGLDLLMPKGSKLFAMSDGIVFRLGNDQNGYGKYMVYLTRIKSKMVLVMYGHLSKTHYKVGDVIHVGDLIALSGDTGNLSEARDEGYAENHMHMEVKEYEEGDAFVGNFKFLDPEDFMRTKLTHTGRPEHKLPCHEE